MWTQLCSSRRHKSSLPIPHCEPPAFVVEDGNYVSSRWPGDAYLFAKRFRACLDRPN
jgi:hypothetical protein